MSIWVKTGRVKLEQIEREKCNFKPTF